MCVLSRPYCAIRELFLFFQRILELPELQTPRDLEKTKVSDPDEFVAIFSSTLTFFFTEIEE